MGLLLILILALSGLLMILKAIIGICSGSIYYYIQVLPGWPKRRSDIISRIEDGWFYWAVCFMYFACGLGVFSFSVWLFIFRWL